MAFIELKNVSHKIEDKYILKNINLAIECGEFVAILGANGSGKSTLAKHINGLILPTEGKVLVENLDTKDEKNSQTIRKNIGIVFQNPDNQIIASIVEDDVAFGPENLNIDAKEIEIRIDNSLELVDLKSKRNFSTYMLSGGQKQKVAIAGVLAMSPKAIIFDEATSMLDPNTRTEVINQIIEINKKNKITIIYITHYIEEILNADKIIILNDGEVVKTGKVSEIFSDKEVLKNLIKWRLEFPFSYLVAERLRENNIKIKDNIYDEKSLISELKNIMTTK